MASRARLSYPGKVAIRHAVEAARDNGIDVGGIEVSPEGVIRIMDIRIVPQPTNDEFDRLDRAGAL